MFMKNIFNETTFGDNQGRPNGESRIEHHTSRPAEDQRTFGDSLGTGSGGESLFDMPSGGGATTVVDSTKAKVNRIVQIGGDQTYQRQFRTCQDFNKGLNTFIANNNAAIEALQRDIQSAISRNVLGDFQGEISQCFMLFQRDVNESISLLSHQGAKFKVHMETLEGLMSIFKISLPTQGVKNGLSDATDKIIEDNK